MIVLFKEGTSHNYKGITCQIQIVDEFGFEPFLKQGWVLNPNELYKDGGKTPKSSKEKDVKPAATQVTAEKLRKAADDRLKASKLSKTSTTVAASQK